MNLSKFLFHVLFTATASLTLGSTAFSAAVTETAEPVHNGSYALTYGEYATQGDREDMEDASAAVPGLISDGNGTVTHSFYGVFDGHEGAGASTLVAQRLPIILTEAIGSNADITSAILTACEGMEAETITTLAAQKDNCGMPRSDGTTATFVVIHNDTVYLANIGDSRAVLSVDGKAVQPLADHKLTGNPGELKRVKNIAAETIYKDKRIGVPGLDPAMLNVDFTRSFGDNFFKNGYGADENVSSGIIATPEIHVEPLTDEHEFIILACDGIWDILDNQTAIDFVRGQLFSEGKSEAEAAQALIQKVLNFNERHNDNCTAMVIRFTPTESDLL